jgi:CheY-like chemotaxis protein
VRPTKTILVVDDVPMFRDLVALFLTRSAQVVKAASGEQALQILREQSIDLVLSDLHMPGMDGAALCSAIKSDPGLCHLPFIMLLREGSAHDSERAVHAGADDMLSKPLARGELIEAVQHFLESGLEAGLPRVPIAAPVELRTALLHTWGTALNISRGGVYIEADCEFEPKSEVAVALKLPDSDTLISPIAQVIWSREAPDLRVTEMGMRFLSIDSETMRRIDNFVSARTPRGTGARPAL